LAIPPGIYDEMAYIATTDTQVFAISITSGKVRWRFTAGAAVTRIPFTTNSDVYLTVEGKGVIRLDRDTGEPQWKLPSGKTFTNAVSAAERVLAVNNKFVYVTDRPGRLLVLDRATGKQLSYYEPFRDFAYPVPNEATDRLVLAANNGMLMCLHDREYDKPLEHRKFDFTVRGTGDRLKGVREKLARKVSEKATDAMPLGEVLDGLRRRYGLDIFISDKAFEAAGLPPVKDKPVLQARADNVELGDVLKNILVQVGATYEVTGDIIMIIPPKKEGDMAKPPDRPPDKPPDRPPDKPPDKPPPGADATVREILARRVNTPAVEAAPLSDMLTYYGDRFNLKFEPDEKALKAAGLEDVLRKEVKHPKGMGIPLATALRDMLGQVKCDFEVKGDTIFIGPAKK
jgi:hypothetical protein